ncbi:MAG TPA: alpha/beta fold hydrolase [Kofleriaceae bacterium]|nr:alpha/beta fold hydrolase [Kofleriaceae bacterium]
MFTRASAAIDRGVVRFMERRMAPRTPTLDPSDARRQMIDLARAYSEGNLGHPSPFFPEPAVPRVELRAAGDGPLGTQVVDLAFRSDYVPFLPAARDGYLAHTENMTAHARWWTSDRGRPTIVLLHGWGGGNYWLETRAFVIPYWLRHGYDIVAFQLPFHGERAQGTQTLPNWPSPNPLRTNEGFGHAIYDLRALSRFLRARGASGVGAMGMSLGGYTTALWAGVAGPADVGGIDFAVAMIPAVSMADLMWRHGESSPARRRAEKAGITGELMRDVFAVHAPLTRAPRVAPDARFVIAGKGDRITPPDQAASLAAHWAIEPLWFEGGHLAQVGRGDALRTVRRALGGLGLAGRAFRG